MQPLCGGLSGVLATGDSRDIPCYRTSLLLDTYKRYFTIGGWWKSRLASDFELTEETIDEMLDQFYRCTACRRCALECPLGIDHGLLVHLGRYILSMAGIAPKALQVSVREQLEGATRNTSKVPRPALLSTLAFLAEEMEELLGMPLEFPVDRPGRDFVFFCAVSDYLMEPDTLMGNAAVLYAAGDWDRWTIGGQYFDAINYGLFYSDWHLERIIRQLVAEVRRLEGRSILVGECGHASRTAREFVPVFAGAAAYPVRNFMEYTAPRARSLALFSALRDNPTTVRPIDLPSCTDAVPTPPEAPVTSSTDPAWEVALRSTGSGPATPSSKLAEPRPSVPKTSPRAAARRSKLGLRLSRPACPILPRQHRIAGCRPCRRFSRLKRPVQRRPLRPHRHVLKCAVRQAWRDTWPAPGMHPPDSTPANRKRSET